MFNVILFSLRLTGTYFSIKFDILHEVWIFFKYIFCCLIEKCIDQAKNEVDRTYLWIIVERASSTTTASAKCRAQESVRKYYHNANDFIAYYHGMSQSDPYFCVLCCA